MSGDPREDLAVFAERIVHCPLEDWQVEALRLETRFSVIVAPRQSGKSRSLAVLALWWATRQRSQRVLIVSAGEEASRRLLADVRALATSSALLRSIETEQTGLLRLTNGSEVRSVPASERQVRGWAVDLLLVDEAALVPDDLLLSAALPTTAARPDARIVLASSAVSASGSFYDFAMQGESGSEHVKTFRWALNRCHWITPSMVQAMRESMSETRFRAEMEGVFASGEDALFSRQILERVTADYLPATLASLEGPARVCGGVDWGATTDRSACVAIARVPTQADVPVFCVAMARRWEAGAPLHDVIREIATSPAHWAALTLETNGLGMPCAQELAKRIRERDPTHGGGQSTGGLVLVDDGPWKTERKKESAWRRQETFRTRLNPVHTSAEMKAATYSALRLLIDAQQLVLPASQTELLRELLLLRVDLTGQGEKIEASHGGHDDLADALALSLCPFKDGTRRWRTLITSLADPRRPRPVADVDEDLPLVTTGAGMEVPQVPIFQSVAGRQLTVPREMSTEPPPRVVGEFEIAAGGHTWR